MINRDLIDSHALHIFVVISESQSLTDAANRLGVTQSAVSQSLKGLEGLMGVELVVRRTTPLRLTHAGLALKQQADVILGDLRRLTVTIRESANKGLINCRVGLVSSMSEVFGLTILQHLDGCAERVQLRSGNTPTLIKAFLNREIDILISDAMLSDASHLERHPLFRDPMIMAVGRGVVGDDMSTPAAIAAQLPMIKYDRTAHIGTYVEMAMRRMQLLANVRTETDDTHTLMRFVVEGQGWSVLSALCLAQSRVGAEKINVLPLDDSRHARQLYLLARQAEMGSVPTMLTEAIMAALQQEVLPGLQRLAPWLKAEQLRTVSL